MFVVRLLLCCLYAGAVHAAATCDRSPLLIRHVDIWSPDGVQRGREVFVSNGRIERISATRRSTPRGLRVIDGTGTVMLPGFVDAHLHFGFPGDRLKKADDHRWGAAATTGRQLLRSGVTSGRLHLADLRGGAMLRFDSQDDCAPMPRLRAGGPAFIPGAPAGDKDAVWGVTSPQDAADKVRREKSEGFEWIAIHDAFKFAPAELDAIVSTARQLGVRILGSGYSQPELDASLKIRADTVDYLDVSAEPQYAPQLLQAARAQPQLTFVVRLGIHQRFEAYSKNPQLIDDPVLYEFMAADVAAHLRTSVAKALADHDGGHAKAMNSAYPTIARKFAQLRASGIALAMGTDSGSPAHFHRDSIWWELRAWRDFGAPVNEALTAATVTAARALHDDAIGRIRLGGHADFVLYRGNLRESDLDSSRIVTVAKGGVLYVSDGEWVGPAPP